MTRAGKGSTERLWIPIEKFSVLVMAATRELVNTVLGFNAERRDT
jgi:hypothetical protein